MELKLPPLMPAQNAVAKLMDLGVVVLSLVLYTGGRMELLNCIILCVCSLLLTEGLEQAGTQSSLLRVADTCVNQANAILDLPSIHISGAELNPERRDLHAENIRFSYGEKPIINGIALDIPQRTITAIVGPSGGKASLRHLLSRFWVVDSGQITLGWHDVLEYDMDSRTPPWSRPSAGSCRVRLSRISMFSANMPPYPPQAGMGLSVSF